MWIGERIELNGPCWERGARWKFWAGHSCDEYGNCSVYLRWAPLGGVVLFWEPPSHFQRQILLPEAGESPWVDKRYFDAYPGKPWDAG